MDDAPCVDLGKDSKYTTGQIRAHLMSLARFTLRALDQATDQGAAMNPKTQCPAGLNPESRESYRGVHVGLHAPLAPAGRFSDPDRLVGLACLLILPLALWLA
jgi:hypothetical protein